MAVGQKVYKAAQDKLDAYVRQQPEMRDSKVRNMVLEKVLSLPQPFTAEQLIEVCKEERISVGTVYNSLNIFILAQILQAIDRTRGKVVTMYELITTKTTTHMQIVCTRCGRETEFHDKAIGRLLQNRTYANFKMKRIAVIVYGECKICRRTAR